MISFQTVVSSSVLFEQFVKPTCPYHNASISLSLANFTYLSFWSKLCPTGCPVHSSINVLSGSTIHCLELAQFCVSGQ